VSSKRGQRRKACLGKVRHDTRAAATEAARVATGGRFWMRAYRCRTAPAGTSATPPASSAAPPARPKPSGDAPHDDTRGPPSMSTASRIEWTDATWNPVTGCTKVSPGCEHCYAERLHERFHGAGSFATLTSHEDRLALPLRWRRPRRVFVNSMSDLFHADVPNQFIAEVFAVMLLADRHTFQLLTKRPARMRSLCSSQDFWALVGQAAAARDVRRLVDVMHDPWWPLPNVWLGVSAEDQHWADIRIPQLLDTPAVVRFVSAEPLLGPISLHRYLPNGHGVRTRHNPRPSVLGTPLPALDWVIVGGESGPGARPMHPDWARDLRDQCTASRVAFLFKQWGAWAEPPAAPGTRVGDVCLSPDGDRDDVDPDYVCAHNETEGTWLRRLGKHAAGRVLDGRTWDQYPTPTGQIAREDQSA
jgi:protein gp37